MVGLVRVGAVSVLFVSVCVSVVPTMMPLVGNVCTIPLFWNVPLTFSVAEKVSVPLKVCVVPGPASVAVAPERFHEYGSRTRTSERHCASAGLRESSLGGERTAERYRAPALLTCR